MLAQCFTSLHSETSIHSSEHLRWHFESMSGIDDLVNDKLWHVVTDWTMPLLPNMNDLWLAALRAWLTSSTLNKQCKNAHKMHNCQSFQKNSKTRASVWSLSKAICRWKNSRSGVFPNIPPFLGEETTMTTKKAFKEHHRRATLQTCDLWDFWSV